MSNGTVSVNMKTFQNVVSKFSPNRSIMVTGRPGIGKSQGVYQISAKLRSDKYLDFDYCRSATEDLTKEASVKKRMKRFFAKNPAQEGQKDKYEDYRPSSEYPHGVWHFDMGLPVIERRLSQLTEGDTTGLPAMGKYGTVFRPCEWLFLAVHHPVTLFLDELNRAMKPVEQATFQLADSHAFYGHSLHDESRLMIACNVGDQYDVTPMDPAAISRYATFELDPTVSDWLDWALENCHPAVGEFIRANEKYLEHKGVFEPNHKYPDRRAWGALDEEFTFSGYYDNAADPAAYFMAASIVGTEAANHFKKFLLDRNSEISAEDVLKSWTAARARLPSNRDKQLAKFSDITAKIDVWIKSGGKLDAASAKNLTAYVKEAGGEHMMTIWTSVNGSKTAANIDCLAPYLGRDMAKLMADKTAAAKKVPEPSKK